MVFRKKIHVLTVAALTASVVSGGMLTASAASASPYAEAAPAMVYYCEENVCAGPTGSASNPEVQFHADEYNFLGHYQLKTPKGKSYNTPNEVNGVGTNNNKPLSGHDGGIGKYCGTAWEWFGDDDYDPIGTVCFNT